LELVDQDPFEKIAHSDMEKRASKTSLNIVFLYIVGFFAHENIINFSTLSDSCIPVPKHFTYFSKNRAFFEPRDPGPKHFGNAGS
jgi:hypothetical protein